jgi:LPXTG-motif cell wall-anchored protein
MSKRRSHLFTFAIVLPAALVLSIAPAFADAGDGGSDGAADAAGDMATTDGGTDAAGDVASTDTGGATDATTTDAPRDSAGNDTAGSDAPRADGGTTPAEDEGDCGCRLGSTGRSSATLPLAGALAGLALVIRRRRRR